MNILAQLAYKEDPESAIHKYLGKEWVVHTPKPWVTVAIHPKAGRGVLVLRGSKNNTTDRVMDKHIMEGAESDSERFRKLQLLYHKLRRSHPEITSWGTVGHSSGGTLSLLMNRRFGTKSWAFNPGMTSKGIHQRLAEDMTDPVTPQITPQTSKIYSVPTDKLSNLVLKQPFDKKIIVKPKNNLNPHDMRNFGEKEIV